MSVKILHGSVVRISKDFRTVYVIVQSAMKHHLYDRIIKKSKVFACDNPLCDKNIVIGDNVNIQETRPISKTKHFIVLTSFAV